MYINFKINKNFQWSTLVSPAASYFLTLSALASAFNIGAFVSMEPGELLVVHNKPDLTQLAIIFAIIAALLTAAQFCVKKD